MPIKRINVDGRMGSMATVPAFGDFYEVAWDDGERTLFTMAPKPKSVSPGKRINDSIRRQVLQAALEEAAATPFRLKGRGHEPRVTLSLRMAGILRGLDLPRLRIDGYGPNHFYPARIFVRAKKELARELGWSPMEFEDSCVEFSVYRVEPPGLQATSL